MKTQKLFGAFLLFLFAFSFASCSNDDDDKEGVFDYSLLDGHWEVTKPALDMDAVSHYVFDAKSRTCESYTSGMAVNGITVHYTYAIDKEKNQITLTDKEFQRTEKYEVQELIGNKMKWKNLVSEDWATDKELAKKE